MSKKGASTRILVVIMLMSLTLIMVYPLIFSFLAGFMQRDEFTHVGTLLPISKMPTFSWYSMITKKDGIQPFLNTVFRTAWYTVTTSFMSIMVGYVLSRLRFPGRSFFFYWIIFAQLIPGSLTLFPSYILMARFPFVGGNNWMGIGGHGFINNPFVLYLGLGNILWIFLFKQSMDGLPRDYEEAASIDGCGFLKKIFIIIFPIQKPIIATIAISTAIITWNDWFTPFIYINDNKYSTLPAVLGKITTSLGSVGQEVNYPLIFAIATLIVIPPLIMFLCMQKYIVQGFASAGIKG